MHTECMLGPRSVNVSAFTLPSAALAGMATQALVDEATLTPKPGLVDGRGPGAHHDLTLAMLLQSAHTLEPYFAAMAEAARRGNLSVRLREELGALGREAEAAMLRKTGGINTHRGAIWALGLLVAAAALWPACGAKDLCRTAGRLARMEDRHAVATSSHGAEARVRYGAGGARGEAAADFPHIRLTALPALRAARAACLPESTCRVHALLALMAVVQDTCLLHRGGPLALAAAQAGARRSLALGGLATRDGQRAFARLERTLLRLWASPGGSADLLAATLLLDRLAPETSVLEVSPG